MLPTLLDVPTRDNAMASHYVLGVMSLCVQKEWGLMWLAHGIIGHYYIDDVPEMDSATVVDSWTEILLYICSIWSMMGSSNIFLHFNNCLFVKGYMLMYLIRRIKRNWKQFKSNISHLWWQLFDFDEGRKTQFQSKREVHETYKLDFKLKTSNPFFFAYKILRNDSNMK